MPVKREFPTYKPCKVSTSDIKQKHPHYIGLAEHKFKDTLYKHNSSFKYESKRNSTELSSFIWGKKKEKVNVNLDWSILDKAKLILLLQKKHVMPYREISHNFHNKESVE